MIVFAITKTAMAEERIVRRRRQARMRSSLGVIEKVMGVFLVLTGIGFLFGWMTMFSNWIIENFPLLATFG